MPTTPDDIVNEALDEIGVEEVGDLFEGSRAARVARRNYDPILRGMFAAAPWNFARRQRQIDLRGDASGQYHANRSVPLHWSYMYEWPNDCVHARWILGLDAYALDASGAPLAAAPAWARPAPFIVTDAPLVNDVASDWEAVEGHSPESTRIIATNQLGAMLVYTGLVQYPDSWDPLFRRAFVATLAARLAMAVVEDKGAARAIRGDQTLIARDALVEARVRDGNEGWTMTDHTPDWIRARTSGGWGPHCAWAPFPFVEDAGGVY
jgi:hypothetical protein